MANPQTVNKLKATVEKRLADMLKAKEPPADAEMKMMHLAVKYLAVQAKLEESEYGDFFNDDGAEAGDPSGIQDEPRAEPSRGRRKANGAAAEPGAEGIGAQREG